MKDIATIIKMKRISLGMTQDELAEKLYVTRQAVSGWERGKNIPDIDKLKVLADLFEMTVDDLLYRESSSTRERLNLYKILSYIMIIIIVSTIAIGVYKVFNPPHIKLLEPYRGSCDSIEVDISYHTVDSVERYLISTQREVTYDFGTYCIPLNFNVEVIDKDVSNAKLIMTHNFSLVNYSNPELDVTEVGDNYYFSFNSQVIVSESMSFKQYGSTFNHYQHTTIMFKVSTEMYHLQRVTVDEIY